MSDHNKITADFVVQGQLYTDEFAESQPLRAALNHVLAKTKNTGQPPENWILTLANKEVDLSKTFKELGLQDGVRFTLSPRTGRGG